ncbi:hypothetical protein C8R47DRAFT_1154281 [Mycena vitilis]|nr:hypothetical protein C8R47DRAFT_1154281 [Mycena vitilis]
MTLFTPNERKQHQSRTVTMASRFLTSKIEIERKFIPTRPLLHALTRTGATSSLPRSIARAHPTAVHFIRDIYYDRPDWRLAAEGLWVRRRSVALDVSGTSTSSWEAKVRVGGDFAASQFVEVEGAAAVEREMQRALGGAHVPMDDIREHLDIKCDLTTRRLSGELELRCEEESGLKNLTVAIDQVIETSNGDFTAARAMLERIATSDSDVHSRPDLFFHEVGELELMEEVRTEVGEHEARRKSVAAVRAAQLETFMRAHPALFPMTPRPRGKLDAYFTRKERASR